MKPTFKADPFPSSKEFLIPRTLPPHSLMVFSVSSLEPSSIHKTSNFCLNSETQNEFISSIVCLIVPCSFLTGKIINTIFLLPLSAPVSIFCSWKFIFKICPSQHNQNGLWVSMARLISPIPTILAPLLLLFHLKSFRGFCGAWLDPHIFPTWLDSLISPTWLDPNINIIRTLTTLSICEAYDIPVSLSCGRITDTAINYRTIF